MNEASHDYSMAQESLTMFLLKNRLNLFYLLAFAPIFPIQYFGYIARHDFFATLIPLYGFLLLWIKKDKLSVYSNNSQAYRFLGLFLIFASLFIYYIVALFYPQAQFYGVANYLVYLVGLFLVFFQVSALKESFTAMFLIVASTATGVVGKWMEFYLEPSVPFFVQIIAFFLRVMSIPANLVDPTWFILLTRQGQYLSLGVEAGCMGIYSFLTFAIIIIVTMVEDPCSLRTKVVWSIGGIIGTFFVNIFRVSLIFVVIYYFGFERWGEIHTPIGYVLFLIWLSIFLLIFSKREAILGKLQTIWRRLR